MDVALGRPRRRKNRTVRLSLILVKFAASRAAGQFLASDGPILS